MNLLALDGGVAAALNLRLLRALETRRPGFLARADMLAGTSDGALILLYLASRLGPDSAGNLRAVDGCIDFFHELVGTLRLRPRLLAEFALGRGPGGMAARFRECFTRHLGDATLGDLEARGRKVLVMALDRHTWQRRTFRSFDLASDAERGQTLVDLALACCSFPVAFPPHRNPADGREYFDAALVTNNPSLVLVREALEYLKRHGGGGLEDLRLLSLGATERAGAGRQRRGLLSWLPGTLDRLGFAGWNQLLGRVIYLPDFILQGSVDIIDLQCADLLGPRYHRVSLSLPEFEYLASVVLPPAVLRRGLDAEAERLLQQERPELAWVDARWREPAKDPAARDGGRASGVGR